MSPTMTPLKLLLELWARTGGWGGAAPWGVGEACCPVQRLQAVGCWPAMDRWGWDPGAVSLRLMLI